MAGGGEDQRYSHSLQLEFDEHWHYASLITLLNRPRCRNLNSPKQQPGAELFLEQVGIARRIRADETGKLFRRSRNDFSTLALDLLNDVRLGEDFVHRAVHSNHHVACGCPRHKDADP